MASPATNSISGYEYKFITEPDDLKCLICHEVARDPKQHEDCGKLFCEKCIEKYGKDKPCPNCRKKQPLYFQDNKSRREIRELPVKCDNMERDCQWEGTVSTLEKHVGVCQFTLVPCPKKCKDDNGILKIMRRDLQQHLMEECPNRDYSCEHCGLKGTYAITLDHYDTCKKKIISCTNEECTMKMERMKIKNHLSEECEHTVISCKYMSIGCDVKLKRKDMRAHDHDDKAHLAKTVDIVIKLQEKMAKLHNDNNMLREETAKLTKENSDRLEAKLAKISNKMTKLSKEKDYQLENKVTKSEGRMRDEMAGLSREKDDRLEGKVARSQFTMRKEMAKLAKEMAKLAKEKHDELEDRVAKSEVQMREETARSLKDKVIKIISLLQSRLKLFAFVILIFILVMMGYSSYRYHDLQAQVYDLRVSRFTMQEQNNDLRANSQQQNDDLQATKHYYDSMTFELTDYRKKMDTNVLYYSPSFYTSHNGYHMKIRVYANGDGNGEGSHVSVYACIVKGKYDDNLSWPFIGDIKIELLNQLEDKNHYYEVFDIAEQISGSCFGSPQFYSIHSLLHDSTSTTQYLKDDTLHFRISAQASGHRPWLGCTTDMEDEMEKKIVEVMEKNNVITFELPGYKEKKDNNEVFISPSFYTSPNGYHMKIEVHTNGNGDGEGTHVSVFTCIIKGKNDDKLNWPFVGSITIELLNRIRDRNHHSEYISISPKLDLIIGSNYDVSQYISHSYLEPDSPYLQDNTLHFRVSVDVLET